MNHARYVLINRLAMPLGAFLLLIAIGRHSDVLLGQYALVMTYYFIMQMVPLLGLTSYVMREVAREPAQAGRYLSTVGALSMAGCVLVDLGAWAVVGRLAYPPEVKQAIAIVGALVFPGIVLFIAEILFMSVHRAKPIAMIAIAENAVRVAASIACLAAGGGLLALFWVFLATRLAALVANLAYLRRLGIVPRWEPVDPALLKRTLAMLPTFLAGTLLLAVFSRLDFFVLSLYEPVESIGYYAIGYRPFEIGIMMLTALLMASFPAVARGFSRAPRHFAAAARNAILGFCGVLAVTSIAGVLLAHDYVFLLFAKQYPRPVVLTQLFMAAVVLAGLDFVLGALLHASDRQHADTRAMTFGGLAQLGLLITLVPAYGIYGALAAKLAATAIQAGIKYALLRHAFGPIVSAGDAARALAIAAVAGAAAYAALDGGWALRWSVASLLAFGFLPAAALALGLLQPLRWLRSRWRPRHAEDATRFADLVDLAVADAREHARRERASGAHLDRRLAATLAYRLARYLHLTGRPRLAALVVRASRMATSLAIDPASPTKPEWRAA